MEKELLDFAFYFAFGFPLLFILIGYRGLKIGSWQQKQSKSGISFRPPLIMRSCSLLLCVYLVLLVILAVDTQFAQLIRQHTHAMKADEWWPILTLNFFALLIGLALLCSFPARRDLRLDLGQRTYRFTIGSILCPKIFTGPWSDLGSVYVRPVKTRNLEAVFVGLSWKHSNSNYPTLGIFPQREAGEKFAETMAQHLGLPLISSKPETIAIITKQQ